MILVYLVMLRMFWFHFGFKEKADVTLRWRWGFFGFKGYGTQGLISFLVRYELLPSVILLLI